MQLAAILRHTPSGRTMKMSTTEPAVQTYYATLMESEAGRNNATYGKHFGVCLEATRLANEENFPAGTAVRKTRMIPKGEQYVQYTLHEFE